MTRLALLADVHANLPALEAVLASVTGEVSGYLCAGDMVGLGPWPEEVLGRLDELEAVCVLGNHDAECVCGRPIVSNAPGAVLAWTREVLSAGRLATLAALPEWRADGEWTLVHGSLRGHLWEFLLDFTTARASFELLAGRLGVFGHTHQQGGFVLHSTRVAAIDVREGEIDLVPGARYLVNPGSAGAPRDGDPRAAYAIVDLELGKLWFRRIPYPIEATVRELERVGLPPSLGERLRAGR